MTLADFTSPALIIPRLAATESAPVIRELSEALFREGRVQDAEKFFHVALKRESATSGGIALPHGRGLDIQRASFAIGRSENGLAWPGSHSEPIRLVFLLAVPENDYSEYLQLISGLARLSKRRDLIDQIRASNDPASIFGVFQEISVDSRAKA